MPGANINKEFHFGELNPQSLRDNDKAAIMALGEIYSNKNLGLNCRTFTGTVTLDITDVLILCDTSGGAITLTLPAANNGSSRDVLKTRLLIFCHTAGTNNVTLSAGAGDLIDGSATITFIPGQTSIYWSDGGTNWRALSRWGQSTWIPDLQFGGAKVGITYAIRLGAWTQVGNMVHFWGRIQLTNKGVSVGAATIPGLKLAAAQLDPFEIGYWAGMGGATTPAGGYVTGTTLQLFQSAPANITVMADVDFTNGSDLIFNGVYYI